MKWGIIATGRIAKKFASTINQMKEQGMCLCAVASRDINTAKSFAEEYSIPRYYASYEELTKDPDIEAVYIATPNHLHFDNVMTCLNNNKHVLVEKPITLTKKHSELMYKRAKEKGLLLMEAFWISMIPAIQKMKEVISQGCIGKVNYARVDYGFSLAPERRYRKFASELGGGALWDIGVYTLGFLRMVFGENPESFQASIHKNEYDTDDFSSIALTYKNGAKAEALTSIGIDLGRKAIVSGSEGLILLDDFQQAQSLTLIKFDGSKEILTFPFDINGFEYEIREAEKCIQEGLSSSSIHTEASSVDTIDLIERILKENQ